MSAAPVADAALAACEGQRSMPAPVSDALALPTSPPGTSEACRAVRSAVRHTYDDSLGRLVRYGEVDAATADAYAADPFDRPPPYR